MSTPIFIINPKIKIFLRKGSFFAGKISGVTNPVTLTNHDFILIWLFRKGGQPDVIAREFQTGKCNKYLPAILPLQNIVGRIQYLIKQQILVDTSKQNNISPDENSFRPDDCPDAVINTDVNYFKSGNNIALIPVQNGFKVWSPLTEQYYTLHIEFAFIINFFATVKTLMQATNELKTILSDVTLKNAVFWLFDKGLIVEAKAPGSPVLIPSKSNVSLVKNNIIKTKVEMPNWENVEADGRIPVYFAPHMKNHYPLALGMISSYIQSYKDGKLLKRFQILSITSLDPQDFIDGPYKKFGPGIWMFSNYMWSINLSLEMSEQVKSHNSKNITIHGGPSTPNYEQASIDFMNKNKSIDISVHGEGEVAAAEILENINIRINGTFGYEGEGLKKVNGITFREIDNLNTRLVRTDKRERTVSPDMIPSPYLRGIFDSYNFDVDAAIIESNRGCPFGCTFCDWGSATNQKVRKFELGRVKQEIEWIGQNMVPVLWIADANFGMYDRDIELAQWICEIKEKYGYPHEVVVNYTKNATKRLAEVIKAFTAGGIISQGIISIQTTDEDTLEVINRKNIKIEKYDELIKIFAAENLPLSTDLMIGLPGITVDAFDRDLQRYFDVDVQVKAYPTQLLPNSPMADPEYLSKYKIKTNDNDYLTSCYSFTNEELNDMSNIYSIYEVADGYCTLRYVLRYLQWEHGVPALTFLQALRKELRDHPDRYPSISWVMKFLTTEMFIPGGWTDFYDEVAQFTNVAFNVERDSAFNTVLYVNELLMPDNMRTYPVTVKLEHDITKYVNDNKEKQGDQITLLKTYKAVSFTVDDPNLLSEMNSSGKQYDTHQCFWELNSGISRAKTSSKNVGNKY